MRKNNVWHGRESGYGCSVCGRYLGPLGRGDRRAWTELWRHTCPHARPQDRMLVTITTTK